MPVSIWEGAKADALIEAVNGSNDSGISNDVKVALMNVLRHVGFKDENGDTYLADLEEALDADESSSNVKPIFELESPFSSTGSNSIDTGVTIEQGKNYTMLIDFTPTGAASTTTTLIFSNKHSSDHTSYLAGQINKDNKSSMNYWGWGIKFDYASEFIKRNVRFRMAFVYNNKSGIGEGHVYDTSSNNYWGYSRRYNPNELVTDESFVLGKTPLNNGHIATIHDAKIYEKALSKDKIMNYLVGGN